MNEKMSDSKFGILKGHLKISTKIKFIGSKRENQASMVIDEEEMIEDEDEELDDDSNLLTFEQSMEDENGGEDLLDDMFVVNRIKLQHIQRTSRLLKFLQLLTEGHHSNLQNFLREQKHANGVVYHKTFDFVSYLA